MVTQSPQSLQDLISRCFRCGLCRAICPVFLQIDQEPAVARGKVQLVQALLAGHLKPSGHLAHLLSRCLSCGLCEEVCPADVPVTEIILRARLELVDALDLTRPERGPALPSLDRWGRYLQLIRTHRDQPLPAILQLLSEVKGEERTKLGPRFPARKKTKQAGPSNARTRVGYFPGCAGLIYPVVNEAVLDVLSKNGVRAVIPDGLSCCGWPFLETGDFAIARDLAERNIRAFQDEELDAIVVGCAMGARMLTRYYRQLLGLNGFAVPVYQIAQFLMDVLPSPMQLSSVSMKICYLPLPGLGFEGDCGSQLLSRIPGLELVELDQIDECCGESLFFSAVHPDLAWKILQHRTDTLARTGCDAVLADNPFCMIQLQRSIEARGLSIRVMHPAEVLAQACRGGNVSSTQASLDVTRRKKS